MARESFRLDLDLLRTLPALAIRQPWAWYVCRPDLTASGDRMMQCKDVENRTWTTKFRGRFLIHAAKAMTGREFTEACLFSSLRLPLTRRPSHADLRFGGIIGVAKLIDVVALTDNKWFVGPYGFVLEDIQPLPFIPCKGSLGFFKPVLPLLKKV